MRKKLILSVKTIDDKHVVSERQVGEAYPIGIDDYKLNIYLLDDAPLFLFKDQYGVNYTVKSPSTTMKGTTHWNPVGKAFPRKGGGLHLKFYLMPRTLIFARLQGCDVDMKVRRYTENTEGSELFDIEEVFNTVETVS